MSFALRHTTLQSEIAAWKTEQTDRMQAEILSSDFSANSQLTAGAGDGILLMTTRNDAFDADGKAVNARPGPTPTISTT